MLYAFQDRENLFLVMDLMTGGDLRFHIGRQRRFSEEQTSKDFLKILRIDFPICQILALRQENAFFFKNFFLIMINMKI